MVNGNGVGNQTEFPSREVEMVAVVSSEFQHGQSNLAFVVLGSLWQRFATSDVKLPTF